MTKSHLEDIFNKTLKNQLISLHIKDLNSGEDLFYTGYLQKAKIKIGDYSEIHLDPLFMTNEANEYGLYENKEKYVIHPDFVILSYEEISLEKLNKNINLLNNSPVQSGDENRIKKIINKYNLIKTKNPFNLEEKIFHGGKLINFEFDERFIMIELNPYYQKENGIWKIQHNTKSPFIKHIPHAIYEGILEKDKKELQYFFKELDEKKPNETERKIGFNLENKNKPTK